MGGGVGRRIFLIRRQRLADLLTPAGFASRRESRLATPAGMCLAKHLRKTNPLISPLFSFPTLFHSSLPPSLVP